MRPYRKNTKLRPPIRKVDIVYLLGAQASRLLRMRARCPRSQPGNVTVLTE